MKDLTPSRPPIDLMTATREERDHFHEGYASGFAAGIDRGRQLADDEAATLWREAARIVNAMAKLDPHVEREERRRRSQQDAGERHTRDARPWGREKAS